MCTTSAASFAFAAGLLFWGCAPAGPPSIVLVTVDTLRPDHLGVYGYARPTTPNLDRLAADALVFERAQSHAPETRTSFASLLTGYLPHETHVLRLHPLPAAIDTLAERLRGAGYATLAVVGNYILRNAERFQEGEGWAQGFDVYDDDMQQRELVRRWPERTAVATVDRAVELLRAEPRRPLFLWVHFQDPHGPYTPPAPHLRELEIEKRPPRPLRANENLSGRGGIPRHHRLGESLDFHHYLNRYDAEIRFFDAQLGRLLAALEEEGLGDAWLVFTSDHGEGMGEHDFYFSHIGYLYQSLTHVPLILRVPGGPAGRRDDFVQHVDVVPTLLAAAGVAPDPRLRGHGLLDPDAPERSIYAVTNSPIDRDGPKASLVSGGFKLIRNLMTEQRQLYDLRSDPGEERDLSADPAQQRILLRLDRELAALQASDVLGLPTPERRPIVGDAEKKNLEALGYVE
ncbi:MAG: sulfatase [Myxococcota bacterium]